MRTGGRLIAVLCIALATVGCSDAGEATRPTTSGPRSTSTTAVAAEPAATDQPFAEVATAIDGFVTREGLNGA
ncbi:MAG TPA: hypothetical protein PKZ82_13055, partial [Microthrixaceae bacterium]|nr:hypothetical protein [Microthrixaceae bacterium]